MVTVNKLFLCGSGTSLPILFCAQSRISLQLTSYYFLFAGKSKEAEVKRINKELANIRSKFRGMLQ